MASITSLGLHQPTGLHYAIQERLLPQDPPSSSYSWQTHINGDPVSDFKDDELLVTSRAVIWSRGGVFRKSFQFDLENEPVTHALFTTFPSLGPLAGKERKTLRGERSDAQSAALVVFLKTQAHVYFLSGTSHVIHLPFEVECAIAAPTGLILQRKVRFDGLAQASLKFPKAPPNSFVSSQTQPWSAATSQNSAFSIADLRGPMQLPTMPSTTLKDVWESPPAKNDSSWPRLFTLTDPFAEIGLVVAQPDKNPHVRGSARATPLDTAEEILHVTSPSELCRKASVRPLVLALTLNRGTSTFTIWRLNYLGHDSSSGEKKRTTSGAFSRRRSSFVAGGTTGASTPVAHSQHILRESLGASAPFLGLKQGTKKEDTRREKNLDLVSSFDPEFESTTIPRRKSRRVSSMLARADLSATHERSAFNELASGLPHISGRRGDSLGSQPLRTSIGPYPGVSGLSFSHGQQLGSSLNSATDPPVDDLLNELRAGGDFEGFHNMGLDDDEFDALRQEILLTKVCSVPADHSNVRYSSQQLPAQSQFKIFTLTAPTSTVDDPKGNTVVLCILDQSEKKLLVLTLYTRHKKGGNETYEHDDPKLDHIEIVLAGGPVMRAKGVLDACLVSDGEVSRILVLTETQDGYGQLSLQAPWSVLVRVPLPTKFALVNSQSLSPALTPRARQEGKLKRDLTQGPRNLRGLRNSKPHGLVDLIDDSGEHHQLRIQLQPRNPHVCRMLDVCRIVVKGSRGGEGTLVAWWSAMQWLHLEAIETVEMEWTAFIITFFSMVLSLDDSLSSPRKETQAGCKSRTKVHTRSSTGTSVNTDSLELMGALETINGNPHPPWAENRGWKWLVESERLPLRGNKWPPLGLQPSPLDGSSFIRTHVSLARQFYGSAFGQAMLLDSLPTCGNRSLESRKGSLADTLTGLHLLHEEGKLNTMTVDALRTGVVSLSPVLAQVARWLGWTSWLENYELEQASSTENDFDRGQLLTLDISNSQFSLKDLESQINSLIPEPYICPSAMDWIQSCLISRAPTKFMTLLDLVAARSPMMSSASTLDRCSKLTPRTLLFDQFFHSVGQDWSPIRSLEVLSACGMDSLLLETLPEGILCSLREAVVRCQPEPPTKWSTELLTIVEREDVSILLNPGQRPRHLQTTLLAPSHEASLDVHAICVSAADAETMGSFDGSAEIDRQAITRLIFKDDRRMNEAQHILNTMKTTVARCKSQPDWTESELLEAQKDHAHMLATRTLAVPSGRGLLYFSARIPLLTQKFHMGGFNLGCVMKPDNNAVGVDRNAFTEDKACWAFFHSGVAAGLSISRDAKGIDSSWIIYNKPQQDLSNRYAGFLLALGLNGHLKSVAKWVAFKFLTPKHTMTSIGLLLGLAVSYLGTMDSLITRLLSVHVTRMLPPGAAELNLSPLTQTTGIMGIGLLYCNTQHRRMSEIMVSEIEHFDPEFEDEPLRNEGYRLAAGFALGFINIGKGADLKGLHDMRLTERLLAIAVGNKKVDLVHVLDKATAAAIVAIALIFMKSENTVIARKIDVPDSVLQYDYIRPDLFLLRTLAKNLIMWSKIEPTFLWTEKNLPKPYRTRAKLEHTRKLTSGDLALYDIIAGLCFSIALRYAGSASLVARDLLIHYLDQFMRICRLEADTYDKKLTRNTVRNCQDLIALAAATVMAGTGDLVVFRRLRSMHGRDDNQTPYGSHLAAHLAIGALFMGGGTFTFSTSNLAIAALLVAFYPIFPSTIQDNKSHLQAFRHFWVLAAEARCLVARDIDTNQPVPIPIRVVLRDGEESQRHTPCLLPGLDQIRLIRTDSNEYWNLILDVENNPTHFSALKSTQTIYVRRRPAHDPRITTFQATLQALSDSESATPHPLEWIFELPAFASFTKAERALVLPPDRGGVRDVHAGTAETVVDVRLVLEHATLDSDNRDRLLGLRLLFEWADKMMTEGKELQWIRREVVERLKARVWMMQNED